MVVDDDREDASFSSEDFEDEDDEEGEDGGTSMNLRGDDGLLVPSTMQTRFNTVGLERKKTAKKSPHQKKAAGSKPEAAILDGKLRNT